MQRDNNIPKGYKLSPFGPIPIDWDIKKGEDVAIKITKGSSPNWQGFQYQDEGVLFVTSENVRDGYLDVNNPKYLPTEFNDKLKNSVLKKGDILINIVGASIGRSCIYNIDTVANINQAVCLFRPNSDFNLSYLSNFLNLPKSIDRLLNTQSDSARPNLTLEDIRNFPFLLPSCHEQTAIANLLSTWDKAINTITQLIAQKELRKKWLMQQLLTGKKRLKGFSKAWKEVRLREIFNEISDVNDGADTHSVMTISSRIGFISQEDKFDRVIAGDSLKKYTQLKRNDFAYNKGNSKTYQMGCIYQLEEKESALVPFVYICFSSTKLVDPKFYKHWFLAHGLDRQLNRIITSGARGDGLLNVNTDDFFGLKVPYPPKEEQTAIATLLQTADAELNLLRQKLDKLKEQKKGLMQVLLTGKKRLNY